MGVNGAISMILVSLDIGTHVTKKLKNAFCSQWPCYLDNKITRGLKYPSHLCVIYPIQHMVCMGDLNEGCMQNKDLLTV